MAASYLVRFDDITATMNWDAWWQVEETLATAGVKPILAVVPDNQDPELNVFPSNPNFWSHVRRWQAQGWTIGLHGYQHLYETKDSGIVGRNRYSEFAGLPRSAQFRKLQQAVAIFEKEGVAPDVWIAPAHSFDDVTLGVLSDLGIRRVSDGYSILPHTDARRMLWIPQQLGRFRSLPFGVWTVCQHINRWTADDVRRFGARVAQFRSRMTEFSEVVAQFSGRRARLSDRLSEESMRIARSLRAAYSQELR